MAHGRHESDSNRAEVDLLARLDDLTRRLKRRAYDARTKGPRRRYRRTREAAETRFRLLSEIVSEIETMI